MSSAMSRTISRQSAADFDDRTIYSQSSADFDVTKESQTPAYVRKNSRKDTRASSATSTNSLPYRVHNSTRNRVLTTSNVELNFDKVVTSNLQPKEQSAVNLLRICQRQRVMKRVMLLTPRERHEPRQVVSVPARMVPDVDLMLH
jgi:hypothetical protein